MINAWSLAWEALNGTMDETYPIREDVPEKLWGTPIDDKTGLWKEPQPYPYEDDGLAFGLCFYIFGHVVTVFDVGNS